MATSPGYFKTGTTSNVLKSLGMKDESVYWRKGKIGQIMMDHPEMDIKTMAKVPTILERPVAVMKSLTVDNSIVVFGNLNAANGDKVMAAILLTPTPAGGMTAEFQLISGAYSRSEVSVRNMINNNSEFLYLDPQKNRTDSWLRSLGLQLPSHQSVYGPIGSIAYIDGGVNINGTKIQFTNLGTQNNPQMPTDEDLDIQQRNEDYFAAVNRGDIQTAQRMVDEVAKQAGYSIKAWHGTPTSGITSFDQNKIGTNTDDGRYGRGFYFSTNKVSADQYANTDGETMSVYLSAKKPWWAVAYHDKAEVADILGMDESALTYTSSGLSSRVVVPSLPQAAQFSSHLMDHGYDSIVIQHGNNDYEVVVFEAEQIKSAEPVTRDDQGNVIPLSERFRTDRSGGEAWKNRDIRFSAAEEDDGIDGIGSREDEADREDYWNGLLSEEPAGTREADSSTERDGRPVPYGAQKDRTGRTDSATERDGKPVPYGAQNDSGERGGQIARAAETGETDSSPAAQNDNAGVWPLRTAATTRRLRGRRSLPRRRRRGSTR